jgi:predicted NUDIX family NTP pyrophosphohydrolase
VREVAMHAAVTNESEVSAGLLVYRRQETPEILLAHPGGPFWSRQNDKGSWSIPKGVAEADDLLASARRAFTSETALLAEGAFVTLEPVEHKPGKVLHAFAVEADLDLANFRSGAFSLEWPLGSGRLEMFPEIDRLEYLTLRTALRKIIPYQWPLLLELSEQLGWRIPRTNPR